MPLKQAGCAVCFWGLVIALQGLAPASAPAQNVGRKPSPFVGGDLGKEWNARVEEVAAPLRTDPRLQVALNLNLVDPRLQELLDRIQKATGVVFRVDKRLQDSDGKCGSVLAVNIPAWEILANLAVFDVLDGSWQKVEGGYHLVGKPKPDDRPSPSHSRSTATAPASALGYPDWFVLANATVSAVCGSILLVRYAKRFTRKRATVS